MNEELAAYNAYLRSRLELVVGALKAMTAAQLNWQPHDGANSTYALAAHTLGNARSFILGIVGGRDIGRDRPAEFASSGDDALRLRAEAAALITEIEGVLASLDPASLDDRLMPPQLLWGEGPAREVTRREAIIKTIGHASLHVGHIELTRDLALMNS